MPVAKHVSSNSRIIAHIDMDCFYVQVEQRKKPHLKGLPTAVVQYNSWKGGGLIAVSYEARKYGVKRSMRGEEAREACPDIQLVQVPVSRSKADLSVYRNAGSEVVSILARRGQCERASIDEVYLDLTDAAEAMLDETPPESLEAIDEEALKSHVLGLDMDGHDISPIVKEWLSRSNADHRDKLLACGSVIVAELRMQVLKETEFTCSAGIAHNKMLAKLASGMNKPAQQTVVPFSSVKELLDSLPIKKMKQLGGKLGSSLQNELGVSTVGDLTQFSEEKLQECYGINTGTWLWNISRGTCGEEVQGRLLPKSHSSGKTFRGPCSLKSIPSVKKWLNELCEELYERLLSDLDQNKRIAHTLTLHANAFMSNEKGSQRKFPSKSCPLRYGTAKIQEDALNLFHCGLREFLGSDKIATQGTRCVHWGITALYVSASKILAKPAGTCSITKYFNGQHDKSIQEASLSSHSGIEQIMGFKGEETTEAESMPRVDMNRERIPWEDVDPTCSSLELPKDQLTQETSLPSLSSVAHECKNHLELIKTEQHSELPVEEPRNEFTLASLEQQGLKRITSDVKRKAPILRFFQQCSASPHQNQDNRMVTNSTVPSSLGAGSQPARAAGCSSVNPVELPRTRLPVGPESCSDGWGYKINEVDHSVIDELPPEIQQEVRAWLQPQKRANVAKRGTSIAHYFLPSTDV